ncbi:hypothetical protein [Sporosarcina cascadiensis]|uniref:hypothetical protein n=1 Tax=Sporosarcina cascadiensis TaxID=2660747 RepID=UPI00129AEB90|nr:hypothetical protein [Sporosarcina cascadiensis]
MKIIKILLTTIVILAAVGYGIFYFGSKLAADEVMGQVEAELESNGQLDAIRQEVKNDPELQAFIAEGSTIDDRDLPFKTKDQAVRVLIKKFSVSELAELQSKMKSGMSSDEKQALLAKYESRLSEDELLALKVLAYKEFGN